MYGLVNCCHPPGSPFVITKGVLIPPKVTTLWLKLVKMSLERYKIQNPFTICAMLLWLECFPGSSILVDSSYFLHVNFVCMGKEKLLVEVVPLLLGNTTAEKVGVEWLQK